MSCGKFKVKTLWKSETLSAIETFALNQDFSNVLAETQNRFFSEMETTFT